jgi:hypothetical protein
VRSKHSSTLEELSVRSNLALAQKMLLNEMEENGDDTNLEKEYLILSAQVVREGGQQKHNHYNDSLPLF